MALRQTIFYCLDSCGLKELVECLNYYICLNGALSFVKTPVAFEEVGLRHILPPHSGLDALGRHPMAKLGDVLGVSRLQHCVLKHPELLPCKSKWR